MGGKEKKGQRIKGNAKPSSSGRSAELLGSTTGFIGFSGLPEGAYVPVLNVGSTSVNEEMDFNIPGEFRLTLRKMGKKDSTTKIKALNEFDELCTQSPLEALKSVLPFWPRIYAKLAIDNDRRVRENAQKAHHNIATKVGRNLAPQLKELMGVWFTSQCDTFSPAASGASNSLKACFPDSKLPEAVAFCHAEIMDYINDCFFKGDDIQEEQKERVLVGAMSGYSLLQQILDLNQEARFAKHQQLWSNSKLYKVVGKNSSSVVKQAWFRMMLTLSQTSPQLIQANASKILPCLFSFLDETDSVIQSVMWESVLKLFYSVENGASLVNLPSGMSPRFLNLLRNGCYGSASAIGPLILPLVRLLHQNVKSNQRDSFDMQLMDSLRQGFTDRFVMTSAVDANAFSLTFTQTLDYIGRNSSGEAAHLQKMFESQVVPLLESLIQSKRSDVILAPLVRHLTLMLYGWYADLESVANDFWSVLETFIRSILSQTPHPEPAVISQLSLLLSTLMDPAFKGERQGRPAVVRAPRIRFSEAETPNVCKERVPSITLPPLLSDKLVALYVTLGHGALECSETKQCHSCLDLLACLLRHETVTGSFLASQKLNAQQMIARFIQPVLERLHDSASASLLFTLLGAVESDQRLQLLAQVINDESTCTALAVTALEKFADKPTVVEWLHGSQILTLLTSTVTQLSAGSHPDPKIAWNLLKIALNARKSSGSRDLVLPESHVEAILSALTSNLKDDSVVHSSFQEFTNPLCTLWQSAARCIYQYESTARFLDAVFESLCRISSLPVESVHDLTSIWNTGAAFNVQERSKAAASLIKTCLMTNPAVEMIDRILALFRRITCLVENDAETLGSLVDLLLPMPSEWKVLTNESNAPHLMAKEILSAGVYCAHLAGQFRSVELEAWCRLIKVAFVASEVFLVVKNIDELRLDLIPYLFYAAASAQFLLSLYSKRPQEPALEGIASMTERLTANVDQLLVGSKADEQLEMYQKSVTMSQETAGWIWSAVARKLQIVCHLPAAQDVNLLAASSDSDAKRNTAARQLMEKLSSCPDDEWRESRQLLTSIRLLLCSLRSETDGETLDAVVSTVDLLKKWQEVHSDELLFGQDLKSAAEASSTAALTAIEMMRFLSTVVELYPQQLPNQLWDFVMCSMTSWCSTLEESWSDWGPNHIHQVTLLSFTVALCRLVYQCSRLVLDVQSKKVDASGLPPNLTSEWDDVFSEAAFSSIVPIFMRISQRWSKINSPVLDYVIECLVASLSHVPRQQLQQQSIDTLSPLLLAKQPAIQLGAYSLMIKLLPDVSAAEVGLMTKEGAEDQEKTERPPPAALDALLTNASLEALDDVRVGDLHLVEPYSEECTQLVAYCLTWKLVLGLCGCSDSELRYQYAAYLGNSGLISRLMDDLFRIIPHAAQHPVDLEQELQPQVAITSSVLQDLATQVYTLALRHLPAVIRRWWNNADKRTATLVEKFTCKCVSPVLCSSDLQHVTSSWDNMTVRVRLAAREAIATYKLNEEASMELVVQLPANYPLGAIAVEGGKKVGVTTSQWRTWMLQLTTFLTHQNGSILDGLTLWKRNVDKRFEGIEECYICYYVLHGSNYQLPKLTCRTCKKKFHAACLYKWFSTSNNSTCPLCRNLF